MFLQKSNLQVIKIDCSGGEISTQSVFLGGFDKQSSIHRVRAVFWPTELKWQIHTHHTAQQCLSLENTNLGQTEPFYERSS